MRQASELTRFEGATLLGKGQYLMTAIIILTGLAALAIAIKHFKES